jgi:hypothetical protein
VSFSCTSRTSPSTSIACSFTSVKWDRLYNSDVCRMKTKIDRNVSTFVYYTQKLRYMFRPFLGHHQAGHKNIKLSSWVELLTVWLSYW